MLLTNLQMFGILLKFRHLKRLAENFKGNIFSDSLEKDF